MAPGRILYPRSERAPAFTKFSETILQYFEAHPLPLDSEPQNEDEFNSLYLPLTAGILSVSESVFGRKSRMYDWNRTISSPTIRHRVRMQKRLGGAIYAFRTSASDRFERIPGYIFDQLVPLFAGPSPAASIIIALRNEHRSLSSQNYQEAKQLAITKRNQFNKSKMLRVLNGGSSKQLLPSVYSADAPRAVQHPISGDLLTDPAQVKAAHVLYFQNLYDHPDPPPNYPKPWLTSPSVVDVRNRVIADPFVWPSLIPDLAPFRALLRRGNPRPSPGPDGCEKWCIKALPDEILLRVLHLVNYQIRTSSVPDSVKPSTIITMHKRGLTTDLANKRGIMLSNLIFSLPFTWLNQALTSYNSRIGLIPDTQLATQSGLQSRDLTSALAQIEKWAYRAHTPIYVVKRDQKKGFDHLHPSGPSDALLAYGFPQSVVDLISAGHHQVPFRVRTAYGDSEQFLISGLTRQGEPMGPIKSTLTTSLGNRWLNDLMVNDDRVVIQTQTSRDGSWNSPADSLRVRLTEVEMMDDSLLFSLTLPGVAKLCSWGERFQFPYNWQTSWEKSSVHVLGLHSNEPDPPPFILLPTIPRLDPLSPLDTLISVPFSRSNLTFLRTPISDPSQQFENISDIISSFVIPTYPVRLQLPALRKLVNQCLFSKIRARLVLMPLPSSKASELERVLTRLITQYLRLPFAPNSSLLYLPVSLHGFGFSSIIYANAAAAVSGLVRDLNHHTPLFSSLARITLTDWTEKLHSFLHPLSFPGSQHPCIAHHRSLPSAWIVAQQSLHSLSLDILPTDQSHLTSGNISIISLFKDRRVPTPPLAYNSVRVYERNGRGLLSDWGQWDDTRFIPLNVNPHRRRTAAFDNFDTVAQWLGSITLDSLAVGDVCLASPRTTRQSLARAQIVSLANILHPYRPSYHLSDVGSTLGTLWATDGSYTAPNVTSTSAVVGPVTFALTVTDRERGVLHAEVLGLIAAFICVVEAGSPHAIILSDHLNSVYLINDIRTHSLPPYFWSQKNARSLYRWLAQLSLSHPEIEVAHVKAHTARKGPRAFLNSVADSVAKSARAFPFHSPPAPDTSFALDNFAVRTRDGIWLESNLTKYVEDALSDETFHSIPTFANAPLLDSNPPPPFSYERAFSAYSARTQLLARSSQLPSAARLYGRRLCNSASCRMHCGWNWEDDHHLFVDCPAFEELRAEASATLSATLREDVDSIPASDRFFIRRLLSHLFKDDPACWPTGVTHYYMGWAPKLEPGVPIGVYSPIERSRMMKRISAAVHTASIRLTGRIWGKLQSTISDT